MRLKGQSPRVISFNLTWNPGQGHIFQFNLLKLYLSIPNLFTINDLYHIIPPNTDKIVYELCGLICFFGNHYVSIFRDQNNQWKLYDDIQYRIVQGGWREIVESMIDGQIKPVMLFYQESSSHNQELLDYPEILYLFQKYHPQPLAGTGQDDEFMNDVSYQ